MYLVLSTVLVVVALVVFSRRADRRVAETPEQRATLDRLSRRMQELVEYLRIVQDPLMSRLVARFDRGVPRLRHTEERAGYSENKGEVVGLCLSDMASKEQSKYENELFYVLLHELAHIGTAEYGHTDEFWALFETLRGYAKDADLLEPVTAHSEVCGEKLRN